MSYCSAHFDSIDWQSFKVVDLLKKEMKKFLTCRAIKFALFSFFDELLFNTLDSIDWQSFKVVDLLKKEIAKGKSQSCQKIPH